MEFLWILGKFGIFLDLNRLAFFDFRRGLGKNNFYFSGKILESGDFLDFGCRVLEELLGFGGSHFGVWRRWFWGVGCFGFLV